MCRYPFRLAASRQATLPLLSLRDIFPRPGEVGPQGDGFSSGGKLCGSAERRPLGGAGAQRLRGFFYRKKTVRKSIFQRTYVNKSRASKKCEIF